MSLRFSLFFCCYLFLNLYAQRHSEHIIWFSKTAKSVSPVILDQLAIERRALNNQSYPQFLDYPLAPGIWNQILQLTDTSEFSYSRWLNCAFSKLNTAQFEELKAKPWVDSIQTIYSSAISNSNALSEFSTIENLEETLLYAKYQFQRLQGPLMHARGFTGKGVRIAIFDAGFPDVDTHEAFQHIQRRNGILNTYHFLKKSKDVYRDNNHGRKVFSNIAGMMGDSIPMGLAINADFMLAITENSLYESYKELFAWVQAAEWAEQNGAHVISSSLGYNLPKSPKSVITLAAEQAAHLGIFVVNSAGNSGNGWNTINPPSDADSIFSIGATNPKTDVATNFSSSGPILLQNVKPELSAPGINAVAGTESYELATGTSFAAPLVAGFVACALESGAIKLPFKDVYQAILESGHLYPYYDYTHGYGIPNAAKWFKKELHSTSVVPFIVVEDSDSSGNSILQQFKIVYSGDSITTLTGKRNLYYKVSISNSNEVLKYGVVQYPFPAVGDKLRFSDYVFSINQPKKEQNIEAGNELCVVLIELFFEGEYFKTTTHIDLYAH